MTSIEKKTMSQSVLLTGLIGFVLFTVAESVCPLCETPAHLPKRWNYRLADGRTCKDVYLDLGSLNPNHPECQPTKDLYEEICCGDEEPDPIWPPTQAPTLQEGSEPVCHICGTEEYPGIPNAGIHARYIGTFSCAEFFARGRNGRIPWFMCGPLQDYAYDVCGCGEYNPDCIADPTKCWGYDGSPIPAPVPNPVPNPVPAPVPAPTPPANGCSGCSGACFKMTIKTDSNPEQTRVKFTDTKSGQKIIKRNYGDYSSENKKYEEELCISDDSCFKFQIDDKGKDGFQSGGYYSLKVDGIKVVDEHSNIGKKESVNFCTPMPEYTPTAPVSAPTAPAPTPTAPAPTPTAPVPTPHGSCEDQSSFTWKKKQKTCAWVAKNKKRCKKFSEYCPATCDSC